MPFHLHTELAYQIKLALHSSTRSDPDIRVELPFDRFLYTGGLQQAGKKIKKYRGHDVYGIDKYGDLAPILGPRWHVRVFNEQMDFCYVILETVRFHLHRRQPVPDFQPDFEPHHTVDGGYAVIFHFVRGDGVRSHWDSFIEKQ